MHFTVSRKDFSTYLSCPRRLALKTMGVKTREVERPLGLSPSHI